MDSRTTAGYIEWQTIKQIKLRGNFVIVNKDKKHKKKMEVWDIRTGNLVLRELPELVLCMKSFGGNF